MTRLTNLTPAEKKFIDDAIAAAERAAGKKLNQPNRHIVLNRARAQIESQRYADRQRALREDERQQSDFAWSRPRAAPLIADFGGLVVLTLRNHLRFTRVHSHAVAQKSSGAFFRDAGEEMCRKRL
jgi:acyl-CoA reductase-like NAD-dependent aldehyde dehydrogenase